MRDSRLYTAIVLLALNSALSGCTLIGYGIGSAIDASGKRTLAPQAFAPENAGRHTPEQGSKIKLILRDGEVVEGKYVGVERLPAAEYWRVYADARARFQLESALPEPGDSVTLALVTGRVLEGEFLGFEGQRWIHFRRETPWRVAAADVVEMRYAHDRSASGQTLDRLMSSGAVPTMSAVALEVTMGRYGTRRTERRLIPLDSVASVTYKPTSNRSMFALVGLAADAVLVVGAIQYAQEGLFSLEGGGIQW